jgi:predicted RNase H-like nuclease
MRLVLGVDGCRGGWCCVAIDADTRKIASAEVHPTFECVLESPAAIIVSTFQSVSSMCRASGSAM